MAISGDSKQSGGASSAKTLAVPEISRELAEEKELHSNIFHCSHCLAPTLHIYFARAHWHVRGGNEIVRLASLMVTKRTAAFKDGVK